MWDGTATHRCTAQFRNQNAFQYDNTASCCWNTVVQNLQIKTSVLHCLGSGTNLHTIQSKKTKQNNTKKQSSPWVSCGRSCCYFVIRFPSMPSSVLLRRFPQFVFCWAFSYMQSFFKLPNSCVIFIFLVFCNSFFLLASCVYIIDLWHITYFDHNCILIQRTFSDQCIVASSSRCDSSIFLVCYYMFLCIFPADILCKLQR